MEKYIMANRKNEQTRKEKEQAEQKRQEQVKQDYEVYKTRITARIEKGENETRQAEGRKLLEIVDYDKWVKKVKRIIDGIETEVEVSGDNGETKNERFYRLAKARLTVALEDMDLLINLSSPQYESTPQQIEKMINLLKLKVSDIEKSFASQKKRETEIDF